MPHLRSNPEIWLISKQDTLLQAFKDALSFPAMLKHFSGLEMAETHLDGQPTPLIPPAVILLDATTDSDIIVACRHMCQAKLNLQLPLIAIIAGLEARQLVLAAGADDYLILPLLPDEFQKRLDIHLKEVHLRKSASVYIRR